MSPELESLAFKVRRSACSRSPGVRAMPGRCTGGTGLAAAASLAFITRRYFPASYIMRWNTALRISGSLLNNLISSAGSTPLALAEAKISLVTACWVAFGSPFNMASRRASSACA